MLKSDNFLRILAIPYSALVAVIFGIMLLSFPIGAYVVFNSDVGKEINFEYPLDRLDVFLGGLSFKLPLKFELGEAFVVLWCSYVILFSISILGPNWNFMKALTSLMTEGWQNAKKNSFLNMITWFSILIVFSVIIDSTQQIFGVKTEPPEFQNALIQFFGVSVSPLTEEIGFRVLLIGLPLYMMFSHKASLRYFFKSLWYPAKNLEITNQKKVVILIVIVGVFFGAAHIISGSPWSTGKFAQATVAGMIIGWVYFRYGLAPAILIHWATNYFIFSYIFFMSDIYQTSIANEFSNPFLNTVEVLLLSTGTLAMAMIVLNYIKSKKESTALTQA